MRVNLIFFLFLFAASAAAQTTATFTPPSKNGIPNLIEESRSVALMNEDSVQARPDSARSVFGFFGSSVSAKKIDMFANERLVSYKSLNDRPAAGVSWAYLPLNYFGYWGFTASLQYSYFENRGAIVNTALHWLGADFGLLYRFEATTQAWVKPFLGLTAGSQILVQRGSALYNTSEARGTGAFLLGTAFNLNRTFAMKTPLLWELQAQWKQVFAAADDRLDFNGNHFLMGMQLSL